MKCFNHADVDAVAFCKSCARALCHECVVQVGLGSSCRDRCEQDVAVLNDLVARASTVYKKNSVSYILLGVIVLVLAFPLAGLGIFDLLSDEPTVFSFIFLALATLFGVIGATMMCLGWWFNQK